ACQSPHRRRHRHRRHPPIRADGGRSRKVGRHHLYPLHASAEVDRAGGRFAYETAQKERSRSARVGLSSPIRRQRGSARRPPIVAPVCHVAGDLDSLLRRVSPLQAGGAEGSEGTLTICVPHSAAECNKFIPSKTASTANRYYTFSGRKTAGA